MSPSWPGTLSPLAGVAAAFAPGPRGVVAGVEKARRFAPPVAGVRAKGVERETASSAESSSASSSALGATAVSYTHLTLPTILRV